MDLGENTLNYSTPARLHEMFVAVMDYLMTSESSPEEWVEFLSLDECRTLLLLAKCTERLVELEAEQQQPDDDDAEAKQDEDEAVIACDDIEMVKSTRFEVLHFVSLQSVDRRCNAPHTAVLGWWVSLRAESAHTDEFVFVRTPS